MHRCDRVDHGRLTMRGQDLRPDLDYALSIGQ